MMFRAFALVATLAVTASIAAGTRSSHADGNGRGLLWRVVQTCIANHNLTGGAFPCLSVDLSKGADRGYAVLRAPFEETHIIVTPTVRTSGIEAERLRQPDAPHYFADAWAARHFVTEGLSANPVRDELALAVNSRVGRSQDQLHIHVDCLRPDVRRALDKNAGKIGTDHWTRLTIQPHTPIWSARAIKSPDLADSNIFSLVADGLHVDPDSMDDATVVVAGRSEVDGAPGFVVLARLREPIHRDIAHGEALLDHACRDQNS